jgi:methionyl-tRNA formyltransferase
MMRIIFMGTPEFAIPSLEILLANKFDIASVVTAPDKPSGRGQQVGQSAVKKIAIQRGLDVLQPESLRDAAFADACRALRPDLMVVVAFRILPPSVYGIPRLGAFNLHASLLPKYRGAAPINRAIMNGERESGVTTFYLGERVDTGAVILQARTPVGEDTTAGELHDTLAEIGAEIVLHTVRKIEQGNVVPTQQDDGAASGAPKIFKEECRINWTWSTDVVHNFIRGLSPTPCAYTFHQGTMLRTFRSRKEGTVHTVRPGTILECERRLLVAAGGGAIEILEVQQEGRKRLAAQEFLKGYRLHAGEFFE